MAEIVELPVIRIRRFGANYVEISIPGWSADATSLALYIVAGAVAVVGTFRYDFSDVLFARSMDASGEQFTSVRLVLTGGQDDAANDRLVDELRASTERNVAVVGPGAVAPTHRVEVSR